MQAECQESSLFNRLKINKLDYVRELVRLGQIGLAEFGDMGYAHENRRDDAFRPREGQVVPMLVLRVETVELRSPMIAPY